MYWADSSSKDRIQNLLYRHDEPNEKTKEGPLSYVLYSKSPYLPQFQQSAGATPL
jgi:hypothetical protein